MATAIEYGLIVALISVVVISAVTTIGENTIKFKPKPTDNMDGDAARALVFKEAQSAATSRNIKLGETFQHCEGTFCETGRVTELPTSTAAGNLDIVETGPDQRGKTPIYSLTQAYSYRIFAPA